jgi:DNA-binding CsgD family transcriptional regulator
MIQWPWDRSALANVATRAMIRVVSDGQSRRLRYGLPILLITATTGLTLILSAFVGRPVSALMLVAVVAIALGRGAWPAFGMVALTGALVALALPPIGMPWLYDPVHAGAVGLLVAEGAMLALIGAVVRATLRRMLEPVPVGETVCTAADGRQPVGRCLAEHLTPRETEVLRMAASGRTVDELAAELFVSPNTVKTHLAHCYGKLGAHNRAEAVALGMHSGVLRPTDLEGAAATLPVKPAAVRLSSRRAPVAGTARGTRWVLAGGRRSLAHDPEITRRGDAPSTARSQGGVVDSRE